MEKKYLYTHDKQKFLHNYKRLRMRPDMNILEAIQIHIEKSDAWMDNDLKNKNDQKYDHFTDHNKNH